MGEDIAIKLLISAILTLWGSIVILVVYIRSQHNKSTKTQQDNLKVVVEEQVKSRQAIENNTKLYEKFFDHLIKATKS